MLAIAPDITRIEVCTMAGMQHEDHSAGKKGYRSPPLGETGAEANYLRSLTEHQTPVVVKLVSGETLRGWIEYYDLRMIRLTRDNAPNLFIYKDQIRYIAEVG